MFKNLVAILKKGRLVDQAFESTVLMLDKANQIFDAATDATIHNRKTTIDIHKLDKEINGLEKTIRRMVLEHLSINPKQDITSSLMLTSVIISIERIGDYSKNIYDLLALYKGHYEDVIDKGLKKSAEKISAMFPEVKRMFLAGETEGYRVLTDQTKPMKREFDSFIINMAKNKKIDTRDAIANVLFARFLKRVVAHLENMVSGVANPFESIGFYQENAENQ